MMNEHKKLVIKLLCSVFIFTAFLFSQNNDIQHSYAFPVPCYRSRGDNSIKFVNLPVDAMVYIYTLDGENVLKIKEGNNGKMYQAEWYFTEYNPASDVYIYVITKDNMSKAGKIIIIR